MRMIHGVLKVLFIFIALWGIGYLFTHTKMLQVDKKAQLFVTDAVGEIVNGWKTDVYKRYVDVMPGQESAIEASFAGYRRLGELTSAPVCGIKDFKVANQFAGTNFKYVDAKYECVANFRNGPASIDIIIYRVQSSFWRIRYFSVTSPFFYTPQTR